MVPTENSEEIGVRPVINKDQGDQVIAAFGTIQVEMEQNWSGRYRKSMSG